MRPSRTEIEHAMALPGMWTTGSTGYTAGIDVGSATSQAVLLRDGNIIAYSSSKSGADDPDSASDVLDEALRNAELAPDRVEYIVGTGCGSPGVNMANRTVNEINCHARGTRYSLGPQMRTILVMGARECTIISCTPSGTISSFISNACPPSYCAERQCNACGAAQGRAIETVAEVLGIALDEVGQASLRANEAELAISFSRPFDKRDTIKDEVLEELGREMLMHGGVPPLSGVFGVVCRVLARTQATGLLQNGWSKEEILAAYCAALAHQAALLVKRIGAIKLLGVTGGVAKNIGIVTRLENELATEALVAMPDPQITAALGAALSAQDFIKRSR